MLVCYTEIFFLFSSLRICKYGKFHRRELVCTINVFALEKSRVQIFAKYSIVMISFVEKICDHINGTINDIAL